MTCDVSIFGGFMVTAYFVKPHLVYNSIMRYYTVSIFIVNYMPIPSVHFRCGVQTDVCNVAVTVMTERVLELYLNCT